MTLIDQQNSHSNWAEALDLWSRIVNWECYSASEPQLRSNIKALLVCMWNEKDWLRSEYPAKSVKIESYINGSKYISVAADLANTIKHRKLTKPPRSSASQAEYYGSVTIGRNSKRRLYFISMGNGEHSEIFDIIRGALDEFEDLQMALLSGSV